MHMTGGMIFNGIIPPVFIAYGVQSPSEKAFLCIITIHEVKDAKMMNRRIAMEKNSFFRFGTVGSTGRIR